MGRPRKSVPRYLEHKQSGRARVVWTDNAGRQCERLLPGPFRSKESTEAYARLLLELHVSPVGAAIPVKDRPGLTLVELLAAYHEHATRHYRDAEGRATSTIYEIRIVIKALREVYGDTPAAEFGPLKLKAACQGWVVTKSSRTECNRRLGIVKRIFKWAASEELVPSSVYHDLVVVTGLKRGKTSARETAPVGPVDDATVDATLPYLNRHVRGLVEFQRLTGCRPGEACTLRRRDIDTGGAVWLYRPPRHKNLHRGKDRVVAIGPKAQALLRDYLTADIGDYLFSPARAMEEVRAANAAKRVTPKYDSHMARNAEKRKARPRRAPKAAYDRTSYTRAVARAVKEANAAAQEGAKKAKKEHKPIPHWHPNQLRHAYATKVRKAHGLEAAQVLLGHERADVTQIYAERNEALAMKIAEAMG